MVWCRRRVVVVVLRVFDVCTYGQMAGKRAGCGSGIVRCVCVCVCVCWLSGPLTYCWFVLDFGVHVRAVPASFLFSLRTLQAAQRGVSVELFQGILDRENVRASKLGTVCFNLNSPDVVGATVLNIAAWRGVFV